MLVAEESLRLMQTLDGAGNRAGVRKRSPDILKTQKNPGPMVEGIAEEQRLIRSCDQSLYKIKRTMATWLSGAESG